MPARPAQSDTGATTLGTLGKVLSEHRAPRSLKIIARLGGPLLFIMALGALAGAFDRDPHEPLAVRVFLALVGFASAGLGAAALWVARGRAVTLVQLYEGGIVELVRDKRREVSWGDVRAFRQTFHGIGRYRFSELKLELMDGKRWRFNSQQLQDLDAIVARLKRELPYESLPDMRQSLQSGRALVFGKVRASREGLHYRKRLLPWPDLAAAQVRRGFLELLMHGDAAPTLRINALRVERADALLALVHDKRQRAARLPPFAVSAAVRQVKAKLWLQSLFVAPFVALFSSFAGYTLYRAVGAFDPVRASRPMVLNQYFAWALLSACLAILFGFGWWHDLAVRVRRERLVQRLGPNGKLVPVLVLEKVHEQWSAHSGWRYRYVTPAGYEATDKLEAGSGEAEPWSSGSDHVLALCSPDERESVLLSASGYPLARLPAASDAA